VIPSRAKICWNVSVTVLVPAPDEPVMAITGCLRALGICGGGERDTPVGVRSVR
jgi:hypothetical protein